MESWWNELRFAARYLLRRRGATATAVLALGIGVGAATTVFSVLHGVVLRPLPYPESERIVALFQINPRGRRTTTISEPNFDDLRSQTRSFQAMAVYSAGVQSVSGGAEPLRAGVAVVSEGYFDVLGVRPGLGRAFQAADQAQGAAPTALVGHGFWQRALGGTTDIDRVQLRIGERLHSVIGVLPAGPALPVGTEIWVPKAPSPSNTSRTAHNWRALARLRANVANMLLAQATVRQGELALRMAIGAGRGHILRQLVGEALLLSLAGGALGVLLAFWGVPALLALEPGRLPRVQEISLSLEVLLFSLGVSLLTALALGLATAWRAARRAPTSALAQGGRGSASAANRRLLEGLVASQVAATAALLVGAGLLGRSLQRVMEVDPGFRVERVVAVDVALAPGSSPERLAARARFHDEMLERLSALPGVRQAGAVSAVPLGGGGPDGTFLATDSEIRGIEDFARLMKDPSVAGQAQFRVASEGYFRALSIPLRRGRLFEAGDAPDAPHVAVISESLAKKHWGGRDPIGRRVQYGNMDGDPRPFTIVGIVGDVREAGLDAEPRPTFYASTRQRRRAASSLSFVAQLDGDAKAFIAAARGIVRELDPEVPPRFRSIAEIRHASLADRRFTLLLLALFGAASLSLAGLGIYGVTSYSVAARTREVGVRMALGAQPKQVLRMILLEGSRPALAGAALGVLAALALSRLLASLLYEVGASDPPTLVAVAIVLGFVSLGSGLLPALRAARVDPAVTLRNE